MYPRRKRLRIVSRQIARMASVVLYGAPYGKSANFATEDWLDRLTLPLINKRIDSKN